MAANVDGILKKSKQEILLKSKVLVIGAGGIGCEVLKNLVLSGFPDIEIIDLDTIDLSNLNRQFLFHREHVGKSKAQIARESALKFNPDVKIKAYHDSVLSTDYGVNFFKRFNVVLNALDNNAARVHVNRMCLNADVPLIESGTAGYNGQVELIKKDITQCFECTPKAAQKSFPGCTIRNTPSELIHCIVWAKHLFNQLFGESVEDEDISPDMADPEAKEANDTEMAAGDDDNEAQKKVVDTGNVARINTRQWAKDKKYEPATLFNKFFYDDINYLLSMANLWKTRKAPTPVQWDSILLLNEDGKTKNLDFMRQYHAVWSREECAAVFAECLKNLGASFESGGDEPLVWDKDSQPAMDFVAACANIRAQIFNIPCKSRFEIKSMAGNIIPAIATTNAITAGMVVLHAFKALENQYEKCKAVYMRLRMNPRKRLLVPETILVAPNPNCYVCSAEPAIHLRVDTQRMRIKDFRNDVLIKTLNMVNPDVILDARGVVLISSEEGETACNDEKLLAEMNIVDGVIVKCDDFQQNYELSIIIVHIDAERDDPLFEVIADKNQLKPKEENTEKEEEEKNIADDDDDDDGPSTSKRQRIAKVVEDDSDDDLILVEDEEPLAEQLNSVDAAVDKLQVTSPVKLSLRDQNPWNSVKRKQLERSQPQILETDTITEISDSDDDDSSDEDDDGPTKSKRPRQSSDDDVVEVINID